MRGEKCAKSDFVKLFFVINLECEYGATELGGDIGIKGGECGKSVGLATKMKCPYIMREII